MQSTPEPPVRKSSPEVPMTVLSQVHVAQAECEKVRAPASTNEDARSDRRLLLMFFSPLRGCAKTSYHNPVEKYSYRAMSPAASSCTAPRCAPALRGPGRCGHPEP